MNYLTMAKNQLSKIEEQQEELFWDLQDKYELEDNDDVAEKLSGGCFHVDWRDLRDIEYTTELIQHQKLLVEALEKMEKGEAESLFEAYSLCGHEDFGFETRLSMRKYDNDIEKAQTMITLMDELIDDYHDFPGTKCTSTEKKPNSVHYSDIEESIKLSNGDYVTYDGATYNGEISWYGKNILTILTLDDNQVTANNAVSVFEKVYARKELFLMLAEDFLVKVKLEDEKSYKAYLQNPDDDPRRQLRTTIIDAEVDLIVFGNENEIVFSFYDYAEDCRFRVRGTYEEGFTMLDM